MGSRYDMWKFAPSLSIILDMPQGLFQRLNTHLTVLGHLWLIEGVLFIVHFWQHSTSGSQVLGHSNSSPCQLRGDSENVRNKGFAHTDSFVSMGFSFHLCIASRVLNLQLKISFCHIGKHYGKGMGQNLQNFTKTVLWPWPLTSIITQTIQSLWGM